MSTQRQVFQPRLFAETQSEQLAKQHEYTQKLKQEGFDFNLVIADAFLRGIRDIGYKSTAWALSEEVDNSIQAGAINIHVFFGYGSKSQVKPDKIAIYDDGHGMEPEMIRAAVIWGGTHREGDRSGFGRYGYGLPSSCVSQGRKYTVYSRVEGGAMHAVTIDLDDITKYNKGKHGFSVPQALPAALPKWVTDYLNEHAGAPDFRHGTVVVIENLDRVDYKKVEGLKRSLLEHFGVTYREFLAVVSLIVDGTKVRPVDPLFITPFAQFYDLTEVLAVPEEPLRIPVSDPETKKEQGVITVRFSYMPPEFQLDANGKMNGRFPIMKEHKGIVICRAGRKIDVVDSKCPWTTFQNYDRNWGIEIDFPPTLDEEFSITTSKQQVVLSERMWEILRDAGVYAAVAAFRKRFKEDKASGKAEQQNGATRPSEAVMIEKRKYEHRRPTMSAQQEERGKENLDREVRRRAKSSGVDENQVRQSLEEEVKSRPFKVEFESMPGAPFFRCEQRGGQRVLWMNQAHRFFQALYAGPGSTPDSQSALELLLFTFSEGELDAEGEFLRFYESTRRHWSDRLNLALDILDSFDPSDDAAMLDEEMGAADAIPA